MSYGKLPHAWSGLSFLLLAFVLTCCAAAPSKAITVGQVDDFQDDTPEHWSGAAPTQVPNAGPNGIGDFALHVTAIGGAGYGGKLLTHNQGFQWDGDWTTAGVGRIAMDVRNPNQFPLAMRIGIAGPGGFNRGFGDVHVLTDPISIPADDAWHSIAFTALADDFTSVDDEYTNTAAALAGVTEFRIMHNPAVEFIGAQVSGSFYVDNIRALAATEPLPGDYNENGAVDAADYVVWRKNDGSQGGYSTWRSNFGRTSPNGAQSHGSALSISSVPEPGTPLLVLTAIAFFSAAAARRRECAN